MPFVFIYAMNAETLTPRTLHLDAGFAGNQAAHFDLRSERALKCFAIVLVNGCQLPKSV